MLKAVGVCVYIYTGEVTIEMVVASCVVKGAFSPSPVTSSADVLGKESRTQVA